MLKPVPEAAVGAVRDTLSEAGSPLVGGMSYLHAKTAEKVLTVPDSRADVQKDRIEIDVWGWGRGLESWLVDHIVIEGGPDRPAAWSELTALCSKT